MRYALRPGEYEVVFEESSDPAMRWLLLPASVERPRQLAAERMKRCRRVEPGNEWSGDDACYELALNPQGTTHRLNVGRGGDYVLFTQHLPREFDMTLKRNGEVVAPSRKFITGRGEYLGRSVEWVELNAIQPPLDDIVKGMLTLLGVVALGFLIGYVGPRWIG